MRLTGRHLDVGSLVPGGVFLLLGVLVAPFAAEEYGLLRAGGRVNSGLMPFVAAVILAIVGGFLVVRGFTRAARAPQPSAQAVRAEQTAVTTGSDAPEQSPASGAINRQEPEEKALPALIILALLALVLIVLPFIGHFATLAVLVFVLVTWVEGRSLRAGIIAGLSVAVVGWVIFTVFLEIPTVRGILP